ncbi:hypothetical protein IM538_18535 [Cytobacillus suaedae]|nr:hypothetical protein IM538_18535 [Cytobacillus suaedae]
MKELSITQVVLPYGINEYGLFKIKGLKRTLFRFRYDEQIVIVDKNSLIFILDSETSDKGQVGNITLSDEQVKIYENEITYFIKKGMTSEGY